MRQIDLYEDIDNPVKDQQEDETMEEADAYTIHHVRTELPPNGSGAHAPTPGTADATAEGDAATPPRQERHNPQRPLA